MDRENTPNPAAELYVAQPLPIAPCRLGESPFWHPLEHALYWCDIPGCQLHRYEPGTGDHQIWTFPVEPACCAPVLGGGLLLGMRDGLWSFDTTTGLRERLAAPPYDPAQERFNDGKADAQGNLWVGTIFEPRQPALAALYRWDGSILERMADGITVSNGLAWSPDGRTQYWSDTKAHLIYVMTVDASTGSLSSKRVWARFPLRQPAQSLSQYGGRPDGAAVDSEGCYWVAMFEGQRLLRLSPEGFVLRELELPVRCPTMLCFGGSDLKTLYITTAREQRPHEELSQQPWAGCVLVMRTEVPGLPVNYVKGQKRGC